MLIICVSGTLSWHKFICKLESIIDLNWVLKVLNTKLNWVLLCLFVFPQSKLTIVHYHRTTENGLWRSLKRLSCPSLLPRAESTFPVTFLTDVSLTCTQPVFSLLVVLMHKSNNNSKQNKTKLSNVHIHIRSLAFLILF